MYVVVVRVVEVLPGELLPELVDFANVVGIPELVVLEKLNELNPVKELDGSVEVDGDTELLELLSVPFPLGPQGPVTIKLALTPPVVPVLVTVMSSQKSGRTIS